MNRPSTNNSFTLIKPRLPAGGSLIVTLKKTMQRIVSGGRQASSFTLIELLIVIGILAILVAAVVVVLNPAQLLAQARDSKRQQDLSALNQALNTVYALDQTISFGTSSIVYTSLPDSSSTCGSWGLPSLPTGWTYNCVPTSTLQNTNGTGWIPVNFKTTGVVSLSALPTDPVNTSSTGLYYTYASGGSFQLASHFESSKFQATEGSDAMYTVGSNLSLAPFLSGLVGYWPLNEGTGTIAYDQSGYNNNGTWQGTPSGQNGTYYTTSNGKTVGYFDGTDNYALVPYNASFGFTRAITMGGWMSSTSTLGGVVVGIKKAHNFLAAGGNTLTVGWNTTQYDGSHQVGMSSAVYSSGLWHYVVMTYDSTDGYLRYYSDGVLVGSFYTGGAINTEQSNGAIGARPQAFDTKLNGGLSDVRVYNRALSASEIQALYSATK